MGVAIAIDPFHVVCKKRRVNKLKKCRAGTSYSQPKKTGVINKLDICNSKCGNVFFGVQNNL